MNPMPMIPSELQWLWSATWQAAVLAALVLLIQGLGRNLLPPSSRFVLWWLVLIRLCLPVTPESAWSVFNLAPQRAIPIVSAYIPPDRAIPEPLPAAGVPTEFVPAASSQAWTAPIDPVAGGSSESIAMAGAIGDWTTREPRDSVASVGAWLFWIWLVGATVYGARLLTASLLLGRHLRRQRPLREPAIERLLDECRQQMGIRRRIDLLETARVRSPALFGLVRPRLLIPPGFLRAFTETELRHVFLHELAHLRRGDLVLNWVMVWIQAMHWFNPLVWLLFARIRSDRELACDALAMARTAERDRATYGQTVLKLLERLAAPSPVPGSVGVLEDRRAIERRVQSIIRFRPQQRFPLAVVGLWIALAGLTLTDGRPVAAEAGAAPAQGRTSIAAVAGEARASMLARHQEIDENGQEIVAVPVQPTEELINEIRTSDFADGLVESALGVLKTQVDRTRRELPVGLMNEFERSLAARLKAIQEYAVDQVILQEYKSAATAKRILETAEHVLTLPYRDISDDVQQRQKAREQYVAALDRFEKVVQDETTGLNDTSKTTIEGALRQPLTDVRQDVFRPGYGQPLSEPEEAELNRIVDRMLEEVSTLPKVAENQAGGSREAAKVARDGWKAIWEFLRGREAFLVHDPSLRAAISTWRTEIASIERAIDEALESATRAEWDARLNRIEQEAEKDIRENDPHTIAERIRQQEEREIEGNDTPNAEVSTGEDSTQNLSPSDAGEPDLRSRVQLHLSSSVRYSHQFSPRSAASSLSPDTTAPDPRSPFQMRLAERTAGANTEPMTMVHHTRNREATVEDVLHVRRDALLDHTAIASAVARRDALGNPIIEVQMTQAGAQRFAEVTRANIGRQLAVVVDGRLLIAPQINAEITAGLAHIAGDFSEQEATVLAARINAAVRPLIDGLEDPHSFDSP